MPRAKNAYLWGMFVRRKVNKSGTTSVVVVDKSGGFFRQVKSFGSSSDPAEIERMFKEATEWVLRSCGQQLLDFDAAERTRDEYRNMLSNVEKVMRSYS